MYSLAHINLVWTLEDILCMNCAKIGANFEIKIVAVKVIDRPLFQIIVSFINFIKQRRNEISNIYEIREKQKLAYMIIQKERYKSLHTRNRRYITL